MRDIWVVIVDLWRFCAHPAAGSATSASSLVEPEAETFRRTLSPTAQPETKSPTSSASYDMSLGSGVVAYVCVPETPSLLRAVHSFDGVQDRLVYGTAVVVGRRTGRFVEVATSSGTGWVLFDDLTSDRQAIFPVCTVGTYYGAEHAATQAIRALLRDSFAARDLLLPLTPEEYCSFRLRQQGLVIAWPKVRPRVAGNWHTLLRGVRGVHMGIVPKTGTLMEWVTSAGEGRLVWIEAVSPDETIQISGVGLEEEGTYTTQTVSVAEWHEWRPVFITIS